MYQIFDFLGYFQWLKCNGRWFVDPQYLDEFLLFRNSKSFNEAV
jgi:hypothetical protein